MRVDKRFLWIFALLIGIIFNTNALAGRVSGTITFDGKKPSSRPISMDADPICFAAHSGPVYPQTFVLGEANTLGNVFVYVKSGLPNTNYPSPAQEAILDQKGCNFNPHVLGVMVGQKVKILNPDGTLHNVHIMSKENQEANMAMPKFRTEVAVSFAKPEFMFPIRCDVHPWMVSWVAVMSNPFFKVTTTDGKFEIKDLPDGTYTIEAWHEKLGVKDSTVIITAGNVQTVDFIFSSPNQN